MGSGAWNWLDLGRFLAVAVAGRLVVFMLVVVAPLALEFLSLVCLAMAFLVWLLAGMAAGSWTWWQWRSGTGLGREAAHTAKCHEHAPHAVTDSNASSTISNKYYMSAIKLRSQEVPSFFFFTSVVTHPARSGLPLLVWMRATPWRHGCLDNCMRKPQFVRPGLLVVLLFLLDASIGMEDNGPGKNKTHAEWKMLIGQGPDALAWSNCWISLA